MNNNLLMGMGMVSMFSAQNARFMDFLQDKGGFSQYHMSSDEEKKRLENLFKDYIEKKPYGEKLEKLQKNLLKELFPENDFSSKSWSNISIEQKEALRLNGLESNLSSMKEKDIVSYINSEKILETISPENLVDYYNASSVENTEDFKKANEKVVKAIGNKVKDFADGKISVPASSSYLMTGLIDIFDKKGPDYDNKQETVASAKKELDTLVSDYEEMYNVANFENVSSEKISENHKVLSEFLEKDPFEEKKVDYKLNAVINKKYINETLEKISNGDADISYVDLAELYMGINEDKSLVIDDKLKEGLYKEIASKVNDFQSDNLDKEKALGFDFLLDIPKEEFAEYGLEINPSKKSEYNRFANTHVPDNDKLKDVYSMLKNVRVKENDSILGVYKPNISQTEGNKLNNFKEDSEISTFIKAMQERTYNQLLSSSDNISSDLYSETLVDNIHFGLYELHMSDAATKMMPPKEKMGLAVNEFMSNVYDGKKLNISVDALMSFSISENSRNNDLMDYVNKKHLVEGKNDSLISKEVREASRTRYLEQDKKTSKVFGSEKARSLSNFVYKNKETMFWGAAFGFAAASTIPGATQVVAGFSFARQTQKLFKGYKSQKAEAKSKGEKFGIRKFFKKNAVGIGIAALTGLTAALPVISSIAPGLESIANSQVLTTAISEGKGALMATTIGKTMWPHLKGVIAGKKGSWKELKDTAKALVAGGGAGLLAAALTGEAITVEATLDSPVDTMAPEITPDLSQDVSLDNVETQTPEVQDINLSQNFENTGNETGTVIDANDVHVETQEFGLDEAPVYGGENTGNETGTVIDANDVHVETQEFGLDEAPVYGEENTGNETGTVIDANDVHVETQEFGLDEAPVYGEENTGNETGTVIDAKDVHVETQEFGLDEPPVYGEENTGNETGTVIDAKDVHVETQEFGLDEPPVYGEENTGNETGTVIDAKDVHVETQEFGLDEPPVYGEENTGDVYDQKPVEQPVADVEGKSASGQEAQTEVEKLMEKAREEGKMPTKEEFTEARMKDLHSAESLENNESVKEGSQVEGQTSSLNSPELPSNDVHQTENVKYQINVDENGDYKISSKTTGQSYAATEDYEAYNKLTDYKLYKNSEGQYVGKVVLEDGNVAETGVKSSDMSSIKPMIDKDARQLFVDNEIYNDISERAAAGEKFPDDLMSKIDKHNEYLKSQGVVNDNGKIVVIGSEKVPTIENEVTQSSIENNPAEKGMTTEIDELIKETENNSTKEVEQKAPEVEDKAPKVEEKAPEVEDKAPKVEEKAPAAKEAQNEVEKLMEKAREEGKMPTKEEFEEAKMKDVNAKVESIFEKQVDIDNKLSNHKVFKTVDDKYIYRGVDADGQPTGIEVKSSDMQMGKTMFLREVSNQHAMANNFDLEIKNAESSGVELSPEKLSQIEEFNDRLSKYGLENKDGKIVAIDSENANQSQNIAENKTPEKPLFTIETKEEAAARVEAENKALDSEKPLFTIETKEEAAARVEAETSKLNEKIAAEKISKLRGTETSNTTTQSTEGMENKKVSLNEDVKKVFINNSNQKAG